MNRTIRRRKITARTRNGIFVWEKYPPRSGQQFLPHVNSQNGSDSFSRKVENSGSSLVDVAAQLVLHEGEITANCRSASYFPALIQITAPPLRSPSFFKEDSKQQFRVSGHLRDTADQVHCDRLVSFFSFTWVTPSTHSSAPALDVVHANFYFFIALCFGPFRLSPPSRSSTFFAPSSPHLDDISGTHRICYNNHKPYVRIWRYSTQ